MGMRNAGRRVDAAIGNWASRVDDQTGVVARRAATIIAVAVRLLRWPTLGLMALAWPFIAGLLLIAVLSEGWVRAAALLVGLGCAVASGLFAWRRSRILAAVDDEVALGTELGVAVAMSDDVAEARLALGQIAGSSGGLRLFSRLRGVWRGLGVGPGVLRGAVDLPRARWFFPPKAGTTVVLFFAALWTVPVSFVACLLLAIAAAAR